MPFLDHLEELRWRILYSLLAVVVGTLVGWVIVEHIDVIGLLIEPIKPLIPGGKLRVTSPTEPFFITLKFAFVVGVVLASPVVGYQAWAFLTPALYERERRLIVPALSAGALLFLAGASAAAGGQREGPRAPPPSACCCCSPWVGRSRRRSRRNHRCGRHAPIPRAPPRTHCRAGRSIPRLPGSSASRPARAAASPPPMP